MILTNDETIELRDKKNITMKGNGVKVFKWLDFAPSIFKIFKSVIFAMWGAYFAAKIV